MYYPHGEVTTVIDGGMSPNLTPMRRARPSFTSPTTPEYKQVGSPGLATPQVATPPHRPTPLQQRMPSTSSITEDVADVMSIGSASPAAATPGTPHSPAVISITPENKCTPADFSSQPLQEASLIPPSPQEPLSAPTALPSSSEAAAPAGSMESDVKQNPEGAGETTDESHDSSSHITGIRLAPDDAACELPEHEQDPLDWLTQE